MLQFVLFVLLVSASHLNEHKALEECTTLQGRSIQLGVLYREALPSYSLTSLNSTFSEYLSSVLSKYGCTGGVNLVMLTAAQMDSEQELSGLDLLFIDPGSLEKLLLLNPENELLATISRSYTSGYATSNIAGALVRRAGIHASLQTWANLADTSLTNGLKLCAVQGSFASWQIQDLELLEQEQARLEDSFTMVWADSTDHVLDMVYDAACDVGAVATSHLERVASSGSLASGRTISLATWAVIGQASHGDYPLLHSTKLYPEWGVIRLASIPPRLGELVRSALLMYEASSASSTVAGFEFGEDYVDAALVEYHLDVFGDGSCMPGSERQLSAPGMCEFCQPGFFADTGKGRCEPCPLGTFNNEIGSASCAKCGPGFSTYLKGSTACETFQLDFEEIEACLNYPNKTLVTALLQRVGETDQWDKWAPTFQDTINEFINRYGCYVKLEVMSKATMTQRLQDGTVHFAFADAAFFSILKGKYHMKSLATILRHHGQVVTPYEGGVIFRDKAKHANVSNIEDLAALNLKACASDGDDFAGFIAQEYEFFTRDLDLFATFSNVTFEHGQEETVDLVLNGLCDIGFIRSHVLEDMERAGLLNMAQVAIINDMEAEAIAQHKNYHLQISTRLYHDWVFAVAHDVEQEIWDRVEVSLLQIREEDPAAVKAGYAGFAPPRDYMEEEHVMYQLNLVDASTGLCQPGAVRNSSHHLSPCVECAPGKYSTDGLTACRNCPMEHFASGAGATSCEPCPQGYVAHKVGSIECTAKQEVLVYHPIEACSEYPNNTLTVGVLRQGTVEATRERWAPTFEDVLNDYFDRFNCAFRMVALSWEELEHAVMHKEVDFVFSYAGSYVSFKYDYGVEAIAELVHHFQGRSYTQMGGVIFRKNGSYQDVTFLEDLKGLNLTACALNENSFSGWIGQWYEFFTYGLDVFKVFSEITFTHDETKTIQMVLNGTCDVGMVPTAVLEEQSNLGHLDLSSFIVINNTLHAEFPLLHSTRLYQEWPVAVLPHVDTMIKRNAAIPLLDLREYDAAAVYGHHAGFIMPKDYDLEEMMKFQLNLIRPELNLCPSGYARDLEDPLKPCLKCGLGRYNNDGLPVCRACLPGYYNDVEGALKCKVCPTGRITYEAGESECKPAEQVLHYHPIEACSEFQNNTIAIGVLTEDTKAITNAMWKPIFEDVMNEHFHRYQCHFKMLALDWDDMRTAIENKKVDFLFADPGVMVEYEHSHGLTAVSSVLRILNHDITPTFGGVIFRRSDKHQELNNLHDFELMAEKYGERLTACATDNESLGGWAAQWYEFFKQGLDIDTVFKVIFTEQREHTVEMVHSGECDVGMVRTSTLEQLVHDHLYLFEDFAIINEQEKKQGFVQHLSTQLYPEWALGVLPHVPKRIAEDASIPLLAIRETDDAAMGAHVAGFTSPYDYSNVSALRWQLGLEALAACGPGAYRNTSVFLQPCFKCPPGSYSLNGVDACQLCEVGFAAPLAGAAECERCPFGYATHAKGEQKCVPYTKELLLSDGAQIAVWFLAAFLGVVCAVMFQLVVVYRETRLIKASSYHFSLVLIFACAVVCLSTVLFALEPTPDNWICSLRWWIPCLFSSMVFGTLFSKTYRLYSIFRIYETKQKVPKSIRFKDTRVASLVASFMLATAVILAIFFGVDPPFYNKHVAVLEGQEFETMANTCHISKVFVPLIFTLYTVLLIGQSYLAFMVRKLPTVFNESQLIAWLLYNTVFVGLVGIMVDFMLDWTQLTAAMMVRAVALLLGSMTPVLVLYLPKLAEIYRDNQNSTKYTTGSKDATGTLTNLHQGEGDNNTHVGVNVKSDVGHSAAGIPSKTKRDKHLSAQNKRSHKGTSNISALSGLSDDGDGNADFDGDLELVPDSDIAGEEQFVVVCDMSKEQTARERKLQGPMAGVGGKAAVKSRSDQTLPNLDRPNNLDDDYSPPQPKRSPPYQRHQRVASVPTTSTTAITTVISTVTQQEAGPVELTATAHPGQHHRVHSQPEAQRTTQPQHAKHGSLETEISPNVRWRSGGSASPSLFWPTASSATAITVSVPALANQRQQSLYFYVQVAPRWPPPMLANRTLSHGDSNRRGSVPLAVSNPPAVSTRASPALANRMLSLDNSNRRRSVPLAVSSPPAVSTSASDVPSPTIAMRQASGGAGKKSLPSPPLPSVRQAFSGSPALPNRRVEPLQASGIPLSESMGELEAFNKEVA
eukprot:g47561.t1